MKLHPTLRQAFADALHDAEGEGTITVYPETCPLGKERCTVPACACPRIVIRPDDPRSIEEIMASLVVN